MGDGGWDTVRLAGGTCVSLGKMLTPPETRAAVRPFFLTAAVFEMATT